MSHRPRKRFGQNFLHDDAVLLQMQQSISPQANDHMIEIGPGLGVLTRHLIGNVKNFEAIEIDRDLIGLLHESFDQYDNFILHEMDVLKADWFKLAGDGPIRVVGNLPYNISTPLMFHLFEAQPVIVDMYFLVQKEVGERLAAPVGDTRYSRLSVMAQYYCTIDCLFLVYPESFTPAPKVDSVFIRLVPRPSSEMQAKDVSRLESVVTMAFSQRRKTIRNSLGKLLNDAAFAALDINSKKRAQDLSVDDYVRIANYLA